MRASTSVAQETKYGENGAGKRALRVGKKETSSKGDLKPALPAVATGKELETEGE